MTNELPSENPENSENKDSLFLRVGGEEPIHELVKTFNGLVVADDVLGPLFKNERPRHVDYLTAWLVEVFGGPSRYTDDLGGFPTLLASHRGLHITNEQADRFIYLFMKAVDQVGMGADAHLRERLEAYVKFGVEVAVQNSSAETDADLHPCQVVPRWS